MRLTINALSAIMLAITLCMPAAAADYKVVIDAGHGGVDQGVQLSRSVYEKDVTLAIAAKIQFLLASNGQISAVLTRANDLDISLDDRKNIARSANADLFISLHINAGFGMKASGYEIYFTGFQSEAGKESDAKDVVDAMLGTSYVNNSIRFANIVDRELGKVFRREGRGLRSAPVAVLGNLPMPGVLIELGFASNVKNRDLLLDEVVQQKTAEVIVESVREYFSLSGPVS
ncbi:MAG TPA: N-acetylmuramoyl-L-alanine amidase [Deltaproteobacteria bacterium]|nr:N-acetylmuramoyl-L-alanine amidase [Deltaproteobacteria bacterium]